MSEYSAKLYDKYASGGQNSAQVIVPMILELLSPHSVLDVGCGTGGWLAEFRSRGIDDVLGLDGGWGPADRLQIPRSSFAAVDLMNPGAPTRRFDVALCLEVAEHLDATGAKGLIAFLTSASSFVVFCLQVLLVPPKWPFSLVPSATTWPPRYLYTALPNSVAVAPAHAT